MRYTLYLLVLFGSAVLVGCDTFEGTTPAEETVSLSTEEARLIPHALMDSTGTFSKSAGSDFTCFISLYSPRNGWKYRYFLANAVFTREAIQNADGDRAFFQYRVKRQNGSLSGFANCEIPADVQAINQIANALRQYRDKPLPTLDIRKAPGGGFAKMMPPEGELVCYTSQDGMTCWYVEGIVVEDTHIGGSSGLPSDWWGDQAADFFYRDHRRGGSGAVGTDANESLGRLIKVVRKLLRLSSNGYDLLHINTWKKVLKEEWAEVAQCAVGIATSTVDAAGVMNILDCIASFTIGLRTQDGIEALKHLGLFDDFIKNISQSSSWDKFVSSLRKTPYFGDVVNGVTDLDVLHDLAKQKLFKNDKNGNPIYIIPEGKAMNPIYIIPEGKAMSVLNSFEKEWNTRIVKVGSALQIRSGGRYLTLYEATQGSDLPTISVNDNGRLYKIRFGRR